MTYATVSSTSTSKSLVDIYCTRDEYTFTLATRIKRSPVAWLRVLDKQPMFIVAYCLVFIVVQSSVFNAHRLCGWVT